MADARRGRFQVVLVWACDRLARSVQHFLEVLDHFLTATALSLTQETALGSCYLTLAARPHHRLQLWVPLILEDPNRI